MDHNLNTPPAMVSTPEAGLPTKGHVALQKTRNQRHNKSRRERDRKLLKTVKRGACTGPSQQITDLHNKYRREIVGSVEKFLAEPQPETKTRTYELARLTELLEREYLLKADAIETEGKVDVRSQRQALVKEINQALARLDSARAQTSVHQTERPKPAGENQKDEASTMTLPGKAQISGHTASSGLSGSTSLLQGSSIGSTRNALRTPVDSTYPQQESPDSPDDVSATVCVSHFAYQRGKFEAIEVMTRTLLQGDEERDEALIEEALGACTDAQETPDGWTNSTKQFCLQLLRRARLDAAGRLGTKLGVADAVHLSQDDQRRIV